jgi:TP901 family phage tail tape measure protein
MPQVVQRRLQIVIDESGADAALKKLRSSAEKLEKEIDKGTKAGRDMATQIEKLSTTKGRIDELSQVVSGKMAPSFRQAQAAVSNLRKELERMSSDNPRYAATFDRFKQAGQVFDEMKTKVTGFRAATNSLMSQIKTVALGVSVGNTISAITETVTGAVTNAIKGAAKLSDEIANIQKVTGLSKAEVEKLNTEFGKINTRTATSALRDIAVALGQAGEAATVANVKALDLINVALGDEFGGNAQEISNVLQVLRNNLGDIKTEDFGTDVTRIANAINELGAKGLATGPVVSDIANRIAGVAQTFGVTSGEILGTAAAFQELGINTERGSTAYIKLLQKMASDTETFASVAGVSVDKFANLVNTNINEALLLVAKNSSEAAGSNTAFAKVLEDLGTEGAGVSELLSKLAANGGLVREKIDLATESLKSNSSILAEFNTKNETLGAQVDKLGKKFAAAFNSSTLRDATSSFIGWLNEVTEAGDAANNEFDRTTQQFKAVEDEIGNLIPRYDELQGRTDLNASEQSELRDIINRVVELVPAAADAFDEYGNALDINKEKLSGYISDNKQLLRELESDAVDSLSERTEYILEFIPKAQAEMNAALKAGDEERAKGWLQTLRKVQVEAVDNADLLKEKYGVELPAEISQGVTAIARALGRITELPGALDRASTNPLDLILPEDTKVDGPKKVASLTDGKKTASGRTGKSKAQTEAERRKKELEDVAKELQKVEEELFLDTLSPYERRLAQLASRYEQLFTKVGSDLKLREKAMRLLLAETQALNREFAKSAIDDLSKLQNEKIKKAGSDAESRSLAIGEDINKNLKLKSEQEFADAKIAILDAVNDYEIRSSIANLKKRQEAEDAAFEIEFENAKKLAAAKGESVELVEMEFGQKRKEREDSNFNEQIAKYLQLFDTIKQGYSAVSDIIGSFEQAKLNKIEAGFNKEQQQLDAMLKQKLISEQDYYIRSQNLEEKMQREKAKIAKKEHKRNQIMSISEVLINAAAGAIKLWAKPGFPANIPLLALLALQTAGSIAKISSSRPPEFAKGGFVPDGPSHKQGGIALIDNNTGRHVGEMEGGEPIISRKVYRSNRAIVDALIQKGWAQDSSPLPRWYTNRHAILNVPAFHHQSGRTHFADGGFSPQSNSDPAAVSGAGGGTMDMQTRVMLALLDRLNQPIRANVIYGEFEETGDAINNIRLSGMIS